MGRPLFSCVIPVKGERPFFNEAVASLESQGLGDELEIIVQDADVEPDNGQSDALNKGFAKAKGEWLFWLNADDVLLPGALKKVRDYISRVDRVDRVEGEEILTQRRRGAECAENGSCFDGINWIAGDTVYIDEKRKVIEVRTDAKWRSWFGKKLSVWTGGPSAFFRRELWEKCGGFDVNLKYAMDIDLWTKWARQGTRFASVCDYVWGFRMHEGSLTGSGRNAAEQADELRAIAARYGLCNERFWRNITRAASLLDGTWFKRRRDSRRMCGTVI